MGKGTCASRRLQLSRIINWGVRKLDWTPYLQKEDREIKFFSIQEYSGFCIFFSHAFNFSFWMSLGVCYVSRDVIDKDIPWDNKQVLKGNTGVEKSWWNNGEEEQ